MFFIYLFYFLCTKQFPLNCRLFLCESKLASLQAVLNQVPEMSRNSFVSRLIVGLFFVFFNKERFRLCLKILVSLLTIILWCSINKK